MKQAISGTWLFSLVILFIFLFSAFVSFSTNYSKVYKVKDKIISVIEMNGGFNSDAKTEIDSFLANVGYRNVSKCPQNSGNNNCGWFAYKIGSLGYNTQGEGNYCIFKTIENGNSSNPSSAYYTIRVFFRVDIPVLSNIFEFNVDGETEKINFGSDDSTYFSDCK